MIGRMMVAGREFHTQGKLRRTIKLKIKTNIDQGRITILFSCFLRRTTIISNGLISAHGIFPEENY